MAIREILLLGNPKLYKTCFSVSQEELPSLEKDIQDLQDTFFDFRQGHDFGRAIAAPQIGFMKRIVFMHIDKSIVMINPVIKNKSDEMIELWDDCMSFPNLLVKVRRHKFCQLRYRDLSWQEHTWDLEGDLAELLQHECDHLDGVLATMLAVDKQSFALATQKEHLS